MLKPIFYERAKRAIENNQRTPFDLVGFLPEFLDENDPRDAVSQIEDNYAHGGGWRDFDGFRFNDGVEPTLTYPGDPPTHAVAYWLLHGKERVILFDHAWVCVVPIGDNSSWRISRVD